MWTLANMVHGATTMATAPASLLTRKGIVVGEQVAGKALNGLRPRLMDAAGMVLDADRPITLVTGYGARVEDLAPLKSSLERAGARNVNLFHPIGNSFGDIRENGAKLGAELLARGPGDVIAWSEGGLITLDAAKHHGASEVIRRGITVGTPHGGAGKLPGMALPQALDGAMRVLGVPSELGTMSDAAVSQLYGTAAVQMRPGSEFLESIHGDYGGGHGTPGPTQWLAISSEHDGIVGFPSAHLPEADNATNYEIRGPWRKTNHVRIMTANDESFQAMVRFLTAPE